MISLLPLLFISTGCGSINSYDQNGNPVTDSGETGFTTTEQTDIYWWKEYTDETGEQTQHTEETGESETSTTTTPVTTTTEPTDTGITTTTGTKSSPFDGIYSGSFEMQYEFVAIAEYCSGISSLVISTTSSTDVLGTVTCDWPFLSAMSLLFSSPTGTVIGQVDASGNASGYLQLTDGGSFNVDVAWTGNVSGKSLNASFSESTFIDMATGSFSANR